MLAVDGASEVSRDIFDPILVAIADTDNEDVFVIVDLRDHSRR